MPEAEMPSGSEPRGVLITFGTPPGAERTGNGIPLEHHRPDPIPLTLAVDDATRMWCYGELASYGGEGDTKACLSRALADWRAGHLACEQLNGRFLLLIQDKLTGEWHVITDRVGSMHAYQVVQGGWVVAIGSDLATVVRRFSAQKMDGHALASLFALGFFLDDRTFYTDVCVLLPSSIYRISADGRAVSHRRYWEWRHEVNGARPYNATVEAYDALLRQAVARRVGHGRPILPISGGLDSRSLALALPAGADIPTYSYGYTADSVETRLAAQVAWARNLPFTAHIIPAYLFERLPEITRTLHGCQDVTMARQMSINAWVHERADAVLSGLWGDVWNDQMGLADGLPAKHTVAAYTFKKMAKRGHTWLIKHLRIPGLENTSIEEMLVQWIGGGLSRFAHIEDPDFRIKAYKTAQWSFRWSNASLRGFDPGGVARVPYYDTDLIDFFCTVPTAFVRDRRLQIDHIKRYAPELARIRWQQAEANLHVAPFGYWISLPRRAFQKALRLATRQRPIQRNWEAQFLSQAGREGLQRWLLQPGLALHEFVSPGEIATLLEEMYARPTAANGYTVSMLLTFSAWLEVVC